MKQKEMYTLDELYANLDISLSKLSKIAKVTEPTLTRIRDGFSARVETVNKLLKAFSEVYGIELSRNNVTGIKLEDKKAIRKQMLARKGLTEKAKEVSVKPAKQVTEKPPKRKYTPRKTDLPEGCVLYSDFAKMYGVAPTTMRDHMLIGLGPGTVPGELGDPMLPVKDQLDYSERDKPGRPGEKDRYLDSQQQQAALNFWRRHGVPFTMPEAEQKPMEDEHPWYAPEQEKGSLN